jgi:hypothetical protein
MFDRPGFESRTDHFEDATLYHDTIHDRIYIKVVSGVCPPNNESPGYMVIAAMTRPMGGQSPNIWLVDENAYLDIADMLLDMSRVHAHYRVDTHYARFKRSKNDDRVYDDFLRHIQRFNLEAAGSRRVQISIQDAPWTNDRGHLKFFLEKLREELRVGSRSLYWHDPTPPSAMSLNGIDDWDQVKDNNTMLGALCYCVAGLLVDKPFFDNTGRIHTGYGAATMKGDFNPTHMLDQMTGGHNGRSSHRR